jgi:hypothetical protein
MRLPEAFMQQNANPLSERYRAYRRRLVAKGRHQLIVDLPRETVAFIDELKERQGLRNRSQVLLQLIEQRREVVQQ